MIKLKKILKEQEVDVVYGTSKEKDEINKIVSKYNEENPENKLKKVYVAIRNTDKTDFNIELETKQDFIEASINEDYADEGGFLDINVGNNRHDGQTYNIYLFQFQNKNILQFVLDKYLEWKKTGDIKSIK